MTDSALLGSSFGVAPQNPQELGDELVRWDAFLAIGGRPRLERGAGPSLDPVQNLALGGEQIPFRVSGRGIEILVARLPHAEGLPLPSPATAGSAGYDLASAGDSDLRLCDRGPG